MPPIPMDPYGKCCYRCGSNKHLVRVCPTGGSWVRDNDGVMQQLGGRPRCFVCAVNTDHNSENCPWRHPKSRERMFFFIMEKFLVKTLKKKRDSVFFFSKFFSFFGRKNVT